MWLLSYGIILAIDKLVSSYITCKQYNSKFNAWQNIVIGILYNHKDETKRLKSMSDFDMEVRLRNWGSSKGIIIPKQVSDHLVLKENDVFRLTTKGRTIILEPLTTPKHKKYKLPVAFSLNNVLKGASNGK